MSLLGRQLDDISIKHSSKQGPIMSSCGVWHFTDTAKGIAYDFRMQEHESEKTGWEQEREALEEQIGAVRAEWQGKQEKALAEIHHHRQAMAQKASLASAVQQQADQLQQSLE